MTEPSIAGTRIVVMRDIIRERFGEDTLQRALATVPAPVREEYDAATHISWVRISTDYAVNDALAETLGREKIALHEELVRDALARSFKTLWRIFLRLTSDEALIARVQSIYSKTRNIGEMHAAMVGPGDIDIRLDKYPHITARDAHVIRVGLESVLTLTGRKHLTFAETLEREGATYRVRWRT